MNERYILNRSSALILHIGLVLICLVCICVILHIRALSPESAITDDYLFSLAEHIIASLFLVVAGALCFDIHVKRKK